MAQQPTAEESAIADQAMKADRAGRYIEAEALLRPIAFGKDGKLSYGLAGQLWEQAVGRMGGDRPLRPARPLDDDDRADAARITLAVPHDAIAEIVARARQTRVVILNESHSEPRSRAFALAVARALRPLGYDVLAAETFDNPDNATAYAPAMAKLAHDGYVRRDMGYYTLDPVFADFVRQSLALGYRPVAYESNVRLPQGSSINDQIATREQAQTDNLIAHALTPYPHSKILIYVGFSHAAEAPLERDGKPIAWMAARLKQTTGIDPLTIDQTTLLRETTADDGPVAAAITRAGRRSSILFGGGKLLTFGQYAGKVDLQVVHPALRRIGDRPGWLAAMGRHPVPIPPALLPTTGVRLIQAFIAAEAADAVPIDQVLVTAGKPAPVLMLPRVPVRYAVQDPPPT